MIVREPQAQQAPKQLPDDPEALKAIIRLKDEELARKEHFIAQLIRMVWGPHSERMTAPPYGTPQGFLPYPGLVEMAQRVDERREEAKDPEPVAPTPRSKHQGRRKDFPGHLPRFRSVHELPKEQRVCACGAEMAEMGEEVTKELERVEATFVHEIARKKYSCRKCQDRVLVAPMPHRVLDRGILGPGFLAHTIVERFLYHMPYHRMERKYENEGLALSRVTLCQAAGKCADLLAPVYEQMKKEVLAKDVLTTDDTSVVVREGNRVGRHLGRMWTYRDLEGRHVYDFTDSRSQEGPLRFLEGFKGYLVADAFPGYDVLFRTGEIQEVACWAHARRGFVEAKTTEPKLADEALELIRQLYAVEARARERALDPPGRKALRLDESAPVLQKIREWLEVTRTRVLERGPMGQAISYALGQWQALTRYLQDGRLPIDNNGSENSLRPVVLGRKNWLFMGNDEGGQRAAVLYSLVRTCKEIGVNPFHYLLTVLLDISHRKASEVAKLTPHGFKAELEARAKAIRQETAAATRTAGIQGAIEDVVRRAIRR